MTLVPALTIGQSAAVLRSWSAAAQTLPPWVQRRLGGLATVNRLIHDLDGLAAALADMPAIETPRLCDYCRRAALPDDIFCEHHRGEEDARFADTDLADIIDRD